MSRGVIVVVIILLLFMCSSCTNTLETQELIHHPRMPEPYKVCNVEWELDGLYLKTHYDNSVGFAICRKRIEKYIVELLQVTCNYRKELEEPICQQWENYDSNNDKNL